MERNFFLYNFGEAFSRDSCRGIVERTAQTKLTNEKNTISP